MTKVLITGVTGQDGSNMADYLLETTDCIIYGTIRRLSVMNHRNIEHLKNNRRFNLVNMDLTDEASINNVISEIKPDYCINFAAQSFVGESWNSPLSTFDINCLGVIRLLEAIRKFCPKCRFYSSGSSEEFGDVVYSPQDLNHPLRPRSPYGASKCGARHIVKVYRESYNLFAIHGTLFNHEGPRRGEEFITRKITKGLSKIKKDLDSNRQITPLSIGNIYVRRDWSDSMDLMSGIWLMLNQDTPTEYLLSSGETHSVKEFIDLVCQHIGFQNLRWIFNPDDVYDTKLYSDNRLIITIDKKFYRPLEVDLLQGDCSLAKDKLGWKSKVSFDELIKKMVNHDMQ